MWVDSEKGRAFVPDDLSVDALRHLPDTEFPEFFEKLEQLKAVLEGHENLSIFYQALFQREAQTFSPRLSGSKVGSLAYVNRPFIPFQIFDCVEALHFAQAAQFAWETRRKPYSMRFLKEVHARLLPLHRHAGTFRRTALWIGQRESVTPDGAVIVVTPPEYIESCLTALAAFGDTVPASHRIAACAMIHFQLVAIHPFVDGNGRLARAALPALLRHYGLVDAPLLFISRTLLDRRWSYDSRIESVEKFGELNAWIRFFARALSSQLEQAAAFVELVARVRKDLKDIVGGSASEARVGRFVDDVLLSSSFRLSHAAAALGMDADRAERMLSSIRGRYGLEKSAGGGDPLYQFGDIYQILAL